MDNSLLPPYPGAGGPIAFPGLARPPQFRDPNNPLFVSTFEPNRGM